MAYRFKPGDYIRVAHTAGSTWQDRQGVIVDVIVRYEGKPVQECAVSLDGDRRWFMEGHLTRTIGPKWLRFFRNQAIDRWKLDMDQAASITGDMDQLVELLCDVHDYTIPRAQSEVEEFYDTFEKAVQSASEWQSDGVLGTARRPVRLPPVVGSSTAA